MTAALRKEATPKPASSLMKKLLSRGFFYSHRRSQTRRYISRNAAHADWKFESTTA